MDEKGLVEFLAKKLVDHPDDVSIKEVDGEKSVILELHVNQADLGKVIGKGGRIVSAIRTLLYSVARKSDKRVILEVIE
jgi:uncharacterized protein